MTIRTQVTYTCDKCGKTAVVETEGNNMAATPEGWQQITVSAPSMVWRIYHYCPDDTAGIDAGLKAP